MKTDVCTQELLDAGRALFTTKRGAHEPYHAYLGARCNAAGLEPGAIINGHLQSLAYRDCFRETPHLGGAPIAGQARGRRAGKR